MKPHRSRTLIAATGFALHAGPAVAADAESMKADCRAHAAKALGVTDYEYGIEVTYEGQRVDKTHAVNGSAVARGQRRTFQCSFARDGRTRAIFFMMGKPIGVDTSQADDPGKFSAKREGDLSFIRIGNERYEIPDAVVLGG